MRIDTNKAFLEGSHTGKEVWICDLRFNDYRDKPIRHVKPMLVTVRSNGEINETIYYSDVHFAVKDTKGNFKKQIVKVFDNTGQKAYTGVPLNVFDNQKECEDFYAQQVEVAKNGFENCINGLRDRFEKMLNN